uniref:alpha-amylase n=1 Tax=Euplotes crassus TaxID=5936 RepID=T1WDH2_EUPCR|nr:alpha-amylase [Moneuplotes crassus]
MKKHLLTPLLVFLLVTVALAAHNTEEWKSRTIYQVITDRFARTDGSTDDSCEDLHHYCGGTFKGIENNLDYIQQMGFDAIWISPIPENYLEDYHGYGALDWYNVNPRFGGADDLKSLINAMHERDMWMMLDVVANHVAYIDMDFEKVTPFDKEEYYHAKCQINNWNDPNEVEYCRLSNLPDLDQDHPFVRKTLIDWVKWVIKEFDIDGLRIDTTPEVKREFWKEYTDAAGCYATGEIFNSDTHYLASYQGPVPAVLNYHSFFFTRNLFQDAGESMYQVRDIVNTDNEVFPDPTILGTFADNHDNARYLSFHDDLKNYQNVLVFNFFLQGIPMVYYGTEQAFKGGDDPANREPLWGHMDTNSEMYKFVTNMVKARKDFNVWEHPHVERYVNHDIYAFSRGEVLVAVTNTHNPFGVDVAYLPDSYKEGDILCNILNSENDCTTVSNGSVNIHFDDGEAKVYVPQARLIKE